MAKGMFFNMPLHGHVNPTMPVVRELVAQGEEMVYLLPESFRGAVERAGARLLPYESTFEGLSVGPDANTPPLPILMMRESRALLPSLLEAVRAEAPDYVVYDPMCIWGYFIARVLKLPSAHTYPSYASNSHWSVMEAFNQRMGGPPVELYRTVSADLGALMREYQLPVLDFERWVMDLEPVSVVFLPRSFQPSGDTFDAGFHFVGSALDPRARVDSGDFPLERLEGRPTLYISLGTVFNNWPEFYRTCFSAFGDSPWQVVLSVGSTVDPRSLGTVPGNFLIRPSVPQLDVLERASVFVTHGGMNSTMEALYHGVPLVVVPQMMEQSLTAGRVTELGLGLDLERAAVTAASLRKAVERVANEPSFRERARRMRQDVREAGGYRRAAEVLRTFHTRAR